MLLKDWLEAEGIGPLQFAYENNVSQRTVHYWMRGHFVPLKIHQQMIHDVTGGKVTYKDWGKNEGQKDTNKNERRSGNNGLHKAKSVPTHSLSKPKSNKAGR